MKKKLLSLLLVLCMVLPLVPVGVLSVTAAAATPAVTLKNADGTTWQTMDGEQGETLTLPLYTVKNEGKTFAGWDLNGDGKADYVDGGAVVVPKNALTLKAVWTTPDPDDKFVAGKTSFKDNMPIVSGSTVTYNNNWQMGYFYDGAFSAYAKYEAPFIQSGDVWGSKGGLYTNGKIAMAKNGYLSTVAYTMPFSGTVELGYDQLTSLRETNKKDENGQDCANPIELDVAIYVNGMKVWPESGAYYSYKGTKTYSFEETSASEDVLDYMKKNGDADANGVVTKLYVEKGDVITFRAQRGNISTWMLYEKPFVNAVSAEDTKLPTSTWSENMPLYDENTVQSKDGIVFQGNWSWVSYPAAKWGNATVLDTIQKSGADFFAWSKGTTSIDWSSSGGLITLNDRGPTQWGNKYSLDLDKNSVVGLRYISEYDGVVSIDIPSLLVCKDAPHFAVLVNGEMVWPTKGGSYTDINDWFHDDAQKDGTYNNLASAVVASATYKNLSDITVAKGDTVEFLVKTSAVLWVSLGSIPDMTVRYTKVYGDEEKLVVVEDPATGATAYHVVKKDGELTLPTYDPEPEDFIGWKDTWTDTYYDMGQTFAPTSNLRLTPAYAVYEEYTALEAGGKNWPVTHKTEIAQGQNGAYALDSDFGDGWYAAGYNDGTLNKISFDSYWNSYGGWGSGILWVSDSRLARANVSNAYADFTTQGAAYVWDVDYTGTIRLDASFNLPQATAQGAIYFSILKIDAAGNKTVVYGDQTNAATEGAGDKYTGNGSQSLQVKHINVTAGDQLVYLFRAKNPVDYYNGPSLCTNFKTHIAYETTLDVENTIFVSYTHPATGRDVKIQLKKGDTFTFPAFDDNYIFFGWDANNDGKVDYTTGTTMQLNADLRISPVLASSSTLYDSLPTYDKDTKTVIYKNGWEIGLYDRLGNKFMPYTGYDTVYNILCNYGTPWNTWGGMYMTDSKQMALKNMTANGMFWSQTQFNASMDGVVEVDYKTLIGGRNVNKGDANGNISYKLAIYRNDEKIWPAGNTWFVYDGKTEYTTPNASATWWEDILSAVKDTGAFPLQIEVNAGDAISFRIEQGNDCSRMLQMNVSAKYVSINSAPKLTQSSVTVKDTFTLNLYAHLNGNRLDYKNAGLRIWTNKADAEANAENEDTLRVLTPIQTTDNTKAGDTVADVTYMFSLKEIDARNLSTKYYARTYITYGDEIVYGDVVEVSVEQYAQNALKASSTGTTADDRALNRLSAAMLQYAAAINNYYDIESDLIMPDADEMPNMPEITPKDVYNMTEFEGNVLSGATIRIDKTVKIVIYINTNENVNGWRLLVDDNSVFKTPQKYTLTKRKGGGYEVEIEMQASDLQTPFYFKVVDHRGDEKSGVLTYSVESYVARMYQQQPENTKLLNLLDAMLVVCKAGNDAR